MGLLDSTPLGGFFYNDKRDKRKALEAMGESDAAWNNLTDPDYTPVTYTGPEEAADVRVDPAAIERIGPSAYEQISTDPSLRSAQSAQLAALENLRARGGMTATDDANLARIQNEEAQKEKAQRDAIMQQAGARGNLSGGMNLMALLNSNQNATNRMSQRNLEVAGMAQDRALKAGDMAANLAGGMQRDDFNRQSQIAAARDQAARFNSEMANRGAQFNAQQQQQAALANMNKAQGVRNQRASYGQQQEQMNKFTQPQAEYQAKMNKAQGLSGNAQNKANWYGNQISQGRVAQGQLWGGAAQLGATMLGGPAAGMAAKAATEAAAPKQTPQFQYPAPGGNQQTWESQFKPQASYPDPNPQGSWEDQFVKYAHGGLVEGDSYQNDIVPALLSPGEVVVPRSMTHEPAQEIGSFVKEEADPMAVKMRALDRMKRGGR